VIEMKGIIGFYDIRNVASCSDDLSTLHR